MKKKFLSSLLILLGVNLLIKPVWILGIDRNVQNITGAEEYGLYFAILNLSFLFNIMLDLGLTNFNNRNIAQHSQLLKKHISSIFILKFVLAFGYSVITFVAGYFLGFDSRQFYFLIFLSINQFLLSFILYLRSNISALQMFKTDSILSVLDRSFMIVLCSVLIWGGFTGSFTIEKFIYAQTVAYLGTFLTCLLIIIIKTGFFKPKWNYPFFIMILKQSAPYALLILLMTFYTRVDAILIEYILENDKYYTGVYAAAFRLLDSFVMIGYLFAVLLFPLFSKMLKIKTPVNDVLKSSFGMLFVFSVIVVLGSYFYHIKIIELLYHDHIQESAMVLRILMFSLIPVSLSYIYGTLLTANGNLKTLNIIALFGMLINITINLILIPKIQALGAAIASCATHFFVVSLQIVMVHKIFQFKIKYRFLLRLILFVITTVIIFYLSNLYIESWLIGIIASSLFGLFFAIIYGILHPYKSIKTIFEKQNV